MQRHTLAFATDAPGWGPHDLQVLELRGEERLGGPYRFELELAASRPLELEPLLYAPARLGLAGRWLGGVLTALERTDDSRLTAVLEPRLVALRGARRSRTLRELSVLDLTRRLFAEIGLLEGPDLRFGPELAAAETTTPPRTRPVVPVHALLAQENETDLDFLLRHLEREGLTCWFEPNETGAERLVVGEALPASDASSPLARVREARRRLPRAVAVHPAGQPGVEGVGERPVRPGGAPARIEVDALWQTEAQARHLARVRAEELLAHETRWTGQVELPLGPLATVTAPGAPPLVVVRVEHSPGRTTVEALRADRPFRPTRRTPWPAAVDLGLVMAQGALRARPVPAPPPPPSRAVREQPALAGAGPLPGPGLGMPEADADDNVRGDEDGLTDERNLWSRLLFGHKKALSTYSVDTIEKLKIPRTTEAELRAKFEEVIPDEDDFDQFENRASAFAGAYGGGYEVNLGDGALVSVGDSGTWSEGKQLREVTKFEDIKEKTSADSLESTSYVHETTERLEGHWSESTTLLTQHMKEITSVGREMVSSTNVGGDIVENTNVGGTLTSNTNVGGILAENTNATTTAIIENVGVNNSMSNYVISTESVTAGVLQEQTNAGLSMGGTIAGMINEYVFAGMTNTQNMAAFSNEVSLGEKVSLSGGNSVDIALGPTAANVTLGLVLDVALGLQLGLFGGVKLDIAIGGVGNIIIGENFGMTIGHQTDMGIGAKTEIGLAKNGKGLTKKTEYFNECLGT